MLQAVKLLLPALIPSWRFFDVIAPSPRIEFSVLQHAKEEARHWQGFRPRPARVSAFEMLKRMVWNSRWNESLFLVSCAERIIAGQSSEHSSEHSQQEILRRIRADLARDGAFAPYLQFRLIFVRRDGDALHKEVMFISPVYDEKGAAL